MACTRLVARDPVSLPSGRALCAAPPRTREFHFYLRKGITVVRARHFSPPPAAAAISSCDCLKKEGFVFVPTEYGAPREDESIPRKEAERE
ncbi:hypothetical protein SSAG_02108 [Streptomyces sp. Mg1]|nr:hypothetical protein SSAG_02108 [Streptomyces sp. Mg1]